MKTISKQLYDEALRFQETIGLKPGVDLKMVLLKGHLLIEELLQSMIDRKVHNKGELEEARLTFHQRLCFARAFKSSNLHPELDWVWEAVKRINSLRNMMSHHITPKGFEEKLEEFVELILNHFPVLFKGDSTDKEYLLGIFGFSLSALYVHLLRVVDANVC